MKRNMDLIRIILQKIETIGNPGIGDLSLLLPINGYTTDEIYLHIGLLQEHGLIDAEFVQGTFPWIINKITWDGYEFLDATRDSNKWNKALKVLRDNVQFMCMDFIKQTLLSLAKEQVKQYGIIIP